MNFIDLTRTVDLNTPVYPGDPKPIISKLNDLTIDGFNMYDVHLGMHLGTHIDAPLHFIENGNKINEINIDRFFGRGVLINAVGKELITDDLLENIEVGTGDILIVYTGMSELWGFDEYFKAYPSISPKFANKCVELGVSIVCVDMPSVDVQPYETHKVLLGNNILIVENGKNFEKLIDIPKFNIIALPSKFATEAAPVRLVAHY